MPFHGGHLQGRFRTDLNLEENFMRYGKPSHAAMAAMLAFTTTSAAFVTPAGAADIQAKTQDKQAQIPTCSHRIGTLAVHEPQTNWWQGLGLESPEALLKVLVQQSGCFTLVDRGAGFAMAQQERALAAGGGLQGGSNLGAGQIRAADYVLVPDIVSKNGNSGGTNVGGLLGGLVGGFAGAIISSINVSSKTADVTLAITNVRTTEQEALTQGHGDKTDIGFGVGGGGFFGGGFAAAGVSNYQNTAIGQVVVLAYIDAYTKLVTQLGGLADVPAAASAPSQSLTMSRPGRLYATASEKSKVVRALDPGMALYPTGKKQGVWVEVSDEVGNKGWVPNTALSNAR
jgi:curli biogenesis system outer membrane secretion channel CsgG